MGGGGEVEAFQLSLVKFGHPPSEDLQNVGTPSKNWTNVGIPPPFYI